MNIKRIFTKSRPKDFAVSKSFSAHDPFLYNTIQKVADDKGISMSSIISNLLQCLNDEMLQVKPEQKRLPALEEDQEWGDWYKRCSVEEYERMEEILPRMMYLHRQAYERMKYEIRH